MRGQGRETSFYPHGEDKEDSLILSGWDAVDLKFTITRISKPIEIKMINVRIILFHHVVS